MTPPVVLLHGLGADSRAFQRFERLLPREWNVRALDLLGHGDAPKPGSGYSLLEHGAYIAGLLEQYDEPAALVGHSLGAAVAVAVAAEEPALVDRLVLLDPARLPGDEGSRSAGTESMIDAKLAGDDAVEAAVEKLYAGESPALRRWIVESWQAMAVGVVRQLDTDWSRFAGRVRCPVAIVHGEPELGATGASAARQFPQARTLKIEGAGHYLHASHARETADAVVRAVQAAAAS